MRSTKRLPFLIILATALSLVAAPWLVGASLATTGDIDFAAMDAYIQAQMHKHGLRGIALAVTQGEEILYLKGYGTAGQGRPMTPQTPMFIGSQSKSFTALAIAQLAEEGMVDIDSPVRAYLPWFAVADDDASARITVAHLLRHSSGLSEAGFVRILSEDTGVEDAVRALRSAQLTAPVGTQFQYFNLGYVVLDHIVETVSGQPYAEYVRQHILDPLQMAHTYTDPAPAARDGLSQGYSRLFGFTIPARQPSPIYELAAGYLISTAEDMAHYAIAMNNEGVYAGTRLLSAQGMQRLFAPVHGYGMGWFIEPDHIYHGGANETFKTFVDLYPRRNLALVLLINHGSMLDHFVSAEQVFAGVKALALGDEPPAVSQGVSVKVIGWGLLAFVLALTAFHARNICCLRNWRDRARQWSPLKRTWDVAFSFIIPTVILVIVLSQVKAFFGTRFNLTYQLLVMWRTLPDVCILMVVSTIPDYAQGLVKLRWLLLGRKADAVAR